MPDMSRLQIALAQIDFAREYTLSLLADIHEADWFHMPAGIPSHIAWQVGHIAMAQYGLALFRQRGRTPEDSDLMSAPFRKQFSRGSEPDPNPANNPSPAEIREVFEKVYAQVKKESPHFADAQLDEPVDMPYMAVPTKLGALYFCAAHEMLHAGQIGLIRRSLGKKPVR
jgi:hypothetical protein